MAAATIDEQAARAKRALKAARAAAANAAKISIDEERNRSTRRHAALVVKAAGLDDVERILAGRDGADAGAAPAPKRKRAGNGG